MIGFFMTSFLSNFLGKTLPYRPSQIVFVAQKAFQNTSTKISQSLANVPKLFSLFSIDSIKTESSPTPIAFDRSVPTVKFNNPTSKPTVSSYHSSNISLAPTIKKPTLITQKPTAKPTLKPTITSQPTAIPPTPTPVVIDTVRPGSSRDEVAEIVGELTCVPPAILKAINDVETNGLQRVASFFQLVNTYGWWNASGTSTFQICQGFAYNTCTGAVPSDSGSAGYQCTKNIPGLCSYDIKVMGPMQVSEFEQKSYLERVKKIMNQDTIDRRVVFDSFVIAALHFKNIGLYRGDDCTNWPVENIFQTACKYYGSCTYNVNGNSGNYCQKVCENYNKYAGTNYSCENNYGC